MLFQQSSDWLHFCKEVTPLADSVKLNKNLSCIFFLRVLWQEFCGLKIAGVFT